MLQVTELEFTPSQGAVVASHRRAFLRNLSILLCRRQEACTALQVLLRTPWFAFRVATLSDPDPVVLGYVAAAFADPSPSC